MVSCIYVYGPKLNWKVRVDRLGKIVKTFPHGPTVRREDASLPAGEVHQTAFAHDGAQTVVRRTITYPNGKVSVDEIDTMYRPWQAIVVVGAAPQATPPPPPRAHTTPVPTPTGGPRPTPSPTFSH